MGLRMAQQPDARRHVQLAGLSLGCRLADQTVRNIVRVSAGGSSVRVRISNAGGGEPLKVGSASVALSAGGAATVAGSSQPLRFGGQTSIVIAAGGEAVSDPVR